MLIMYYDDNNNTFQARIDSRREHNANIQKVNHLVNQDLKGEEPKLIHVRFAYSSIIVIHHMYFIFSHRYDYTAVYVFFFNYSYEMS